MKTLRPLVFVALFVKISPNLAQPDPGMGARPFAMAAISSVGSDSYAFFNNVGAMAIPTAPTLAFAYDVSMQLPGANRTAAGFAFPAGSFAGGLQFYRFGDALYSEQCLSLAAAHRIGNSTLGLRLNAVQTQAMPAFRQTGLTLDFGGSTRITKHLLVGAYVTHLTSVAETPSTTRMFAGLAFQPNAAWTLMTEVEKNADYPSRWKFGFEYNYRQQLFLRGGLSTPPHGYSCGIGGERHRVRVDYGLRFHEVIGWGQQASALIRLGQTQK